MKEIMHSVRGTLKYINKIKSYSCVLHIILPEKYFKDNATKK